MAQREVRAYVLDAAQAVDTYRSYQFPAARAKKTGPGGLVNPPLDLGRLAGFYDESVWHRNAVRVKARDLVGHGWSLEPEFAQGGGPAGAEAEKERLDAFFWNGGVDGFTQAERTGRPHSPAFLPQRGVGADAD